MKKKMKSLKWVSRTSGKSSHRKRILRQNSLISLLCVVLSPKQRIFLSLRSKPPISRQSDSQSDHDRVSSSRRAKGSSLRIFHGDPAIRQIQKTGIRVLRSHLQIGPAPTIGPGLSRGRQFLSRVPTRSMPKTEPGERNYWSDVLPKGNMLSWRNSG
ncbi:hypothetical protein DY000_02007041 [Brassica cretica]|uniref:Uncharacterized protein n=1 Tax=Brassica cretica TaxID=69181 RepID=A0ABQ7CG78_BRACR|nr:hypothetical protein DY000_02007041 [Brassica cretica]